MNGCSLQQVLQQNLGWFFFLTLENLFLRGFILKPTERAYVLVKNGNSDFQIALHLRDQHVFVTITENFKRFQYLNFETDYLENGNLFQKTGARFLIESTKTEKCIISIQNCHVRNQC